MASICKVITCQGAFASAEGIISKYICSLEAILLMCEPCSVFFGEHKVTHQEGMTTGLLLILCISVSEQYPFQSFVFKGWRCLLNCVQENVDAASVSVLVSV